jgi:DivIVA domain-containing protein
MRCHECAAEVAVTARVCSGCGAPIVGQPPVMADAVTDTVVGAVSDAAGKAGAAGVAGLAYQEPYVPGSGDRLPANLRLVLAGYLGIACAWFATALACATAFASLFFLGDDFPPDMVLGDNGLYWLLFIMAFSAFLIGVSVGAGAGPVKGVQALKARIRFSSLLRQPSDPRMATVMASKRGGRTLALDINPGGYQPLSEVRLALWMKAEMLVPGERVTVCGRPDGESELLISSAQRGRAFLGTMKSRSTVQPGPVTPLEEKVSGATLVDWAAWAASTTFSSTGLKFGYDKQEVDAFRSAVRDTFLGESQPPLRADDVRRKQFSTHQPGYDKAQVDAFLEAAGLRLAAMESTDGPAGPLVSDALLVAWAEWADSATFSGPGWRRRGYRSIEVDALREEIRDTFLGVNGLPVKSDDVRGTQFSSNEPQFEYDKKQVDAFLDAAGLRLAAMESTDTPDGPLVSGAILAGWADSTRFSTSRLRVGRYDRAEVDVFREAVRDTFLGVSRSPLTWRAPPGQQFTTTRGLRPGYDPEQVDAFFDEAEQKLAAMESTDRPEGPLVSGTILTDGPSGPTQQDFQPPRWAEWAEWAEWADSTRFSTTPRRGWGYATAEVDAFQQEIRDTFLGVRQPPLTVDEAHDKRFRMARPGYKVEQVDAFFDEAEPRLAAMRPTNRRRRD